MGKVLFCLLYVPCIATISAIKHELDIKNAIFVVLLQCLIAWILIVVKKCDYCKAKDVKNFEVLASKIKCLKMSFLHCFYYISYF